MTSRYVNGRATSSDSVAFVEWTCRQTFTPQQLRCAEKTHEDRVTWPNNASLRLDLARVSNDLSWEGLPLPPPASANLPLASTGEACPFCFGRLPSRARCAEGEAISGPPTQPSLEASQMVSE